MTRKIIFHGNYFLEFYSKLDPKVKAKVQYVLELIKQVERVPVKFLAPMNGSEGLYEVRVEYQSNISGSFAASMRKSLSSCSTASRRKRRKPLKKNWKRRCD